MIQAIRKRLNQKGFTLIELMVVVAILGILAAIAIPKFNESTAKANTARIQADLRTLDSALVQYQVDNGTYATGATPTLSDLNKYVNGAADLKPPKGKCYMGSDKLVDVTGDYTITVTADGARATLNSKSAEGYGYVKSSS